MKSIKEIFSFSQKKEEEPKKTNDKVNKRFKYDRTNK